MHTADVCRLEWHHARLAPSAELPQIYTCCACCACCADTIITGFRRSLAPGIRVRPSSHLWLDNCVFRDITLTQPGMHLLIQATAIAAESNVQLVLVVSPTPSPLRGPSHLPTLIELVADHCHEWCLQHDHNTCSGLGGCLAASFALCEALRAHSEPSATLMQTARLFCARVMVSVKGPAPPLQGSEWTLQ